MEYIRYKKTELIRSASANYVIENTQFVPYIKPEVRYFDNFWYMGPYALFFAISTGFH